MRSGEGTTLYIQLIKIGCSIFFNVYYDNYFNINIDRRPQLYRWRSKYTKTADRQTTRTKIMIQA